MLYMVIFLQFGPNGFAFAINSNGYIVFHPYMEIEVCTM